MCGCKVFSTIGHLTSCYSSHISYNDFFERTIIVHNFSYMAICSKSSTCIIDDECTLYRCCSYVISGFCCIFTPIHRISSSCSLLSHTIDIRKEFRRNPCSSVGTVSFCKCIFYIHIHIPDWDDISLFEWFSWILHRFCQCLCDFGIIVSI